MMKLAVATAAAMLLVAVSPSSAVSGESVPVYRETFNVPGAGDPTNLSGHAVAAALGWKGLRNGGSFNNPCGSSVVAGETCLQAFSSGSTPQPSLGNPPVFAGEGNAFWSPQVIGVTVYTEEKPIPVV
jgi:hypothetical protein